MAEISWRNNKNLVQRQAYLFDNVCLSDIVLELPDGTQFPAHKFVLSSASSVFEKMFYGPLADGQSVAKIDESSSKAFKEMLRFIYTENAELTLDNIVDVMRLADMYDLGQLEKIGLQFLDLKIGCHGCFVSIYNQCHNWNMKLTKHCESYIDSNFATHIIGLKEFKDLSLDALQSIIKRASLVISEICLFEALIEWVKNAGGKNGKYNSFKTQKKVLKVFDFVRFPIMTTNEFYECVAAAPFLFTDKDISDIVHFQSRGFQSGHMKYNCTSRTSYNISTGHPNVKESLYFEPLFDFLN